MSRIRIQRDVLTDPSWWHWATTIPMLILHLSGVHGAIEAAIAVCFCFTCAYFIRLRSWKPFPIQIRLAFLGLLLVGLLPGMIWVHWVQVIGTTAMVTVGYCLLARILRLAPFNRTETLTWSLIGQVLLRDPCSGGLLSLSQVPVPVGACCSMRNYSATPMCTLPEVASSELTSPLVTADLNASDGHRIGIQSMRREGTLSAFFKRSSLRGVSGNAGPPLR